MALDGQLILICPRDVPLLGHILRRHAHVTVVERIAQRGDHHVDQRGVVHPRAPAHRRRKIRAAAHVLRAAGHRHVGVAEHDRLSRRDDRLQSAAAQAIERECRRFDRQAALDAGHAGQVVVVRVGVNDVAEHDVADRLRFDMRPACTASRTQSAARSLGGMSFKLPPYPPIGVRAPLTTTTSRVI